MIEYDNGPGTRTRRHWVSATIGITAMGVFALLSLALLLGVLFGPGSVKSLADKAFPWSLGRSRPGRRSRPLISTVVSIGSKTRCPNLRPDSLYLKGYAPKHSCPPRRFR